MKTIEIKYINHDKIKKGQMIYKGKVFKCLTDVGAIPYKAKEFPIIQTKLTDKELEKLWRSSLPRFTDKELLEIFPEARGCLEERLEDIGKRGEKLMKTYKELLVNAEKYFGFTRFFKELIIQIFWGDELDALVKEQQKIDRILNEKKTSNQGITQQQIEQARDYPMENLIEANKQHFALCPFHNEKHPSFYIKNNYGYCFSCGKSCDTIGLLMERDGFSFREAIEKLT